MAMMSMILAILIRKFLLKERLAAAHREKEFEVSSAATSTEELGNGVYPPAARVLEGHKVPYNAHHRAHQITRKEFDGADLILCMDERNLGNLKRMFGTLPEKVKLLSEFGKFSGGIEDPWYTGNYEKVYREIRSSVDGLVERFS